jgi:ribosomal protein S18 acetylase RimI-like enzyme
MVHYSDSETLTYEEYVGFLRRSDLGSQYPKQNFEARICRLLSNTDICITARTPEGLLVGICFGVTDFAYFLFLTDLAVDRDYVKQGIGKELLSRMHQKAGGEDDITVTTISNDAAIGFYEACGFRTQVDLMVKPCREWESFVVS